MAEATEPSILKQRLPRRTLDFAAAVRWAKVKHGVGQLRQGFDIARLSLRHGFEAKDYYLYGLFRPELAADERRAYLSIREIVAFNRSLNRPELRTQNPLINDKMLCHIVFQHCTVPTPRLLAHAAARFRFPEPRTMSTPEEIATFLRAPGSLPCFGKPVHGSRGIGAASFVQLSQDGATITLGDGREVSVEALAREVLASFPEGYLFQELLTHGPELAALVGRTAGTLRIVTLQSDDGPRALYGTLRLPDAGAMVDSTISGRVLAAEIDLSTGRILRVQDLFRLSGADVEAHPVTGATLPGLTLPDFAEGLRIVTEAHGLLADHGLLGWDVILTDHGPVVTEVNVNPLHYTHQRTANRGLLNPDNMPLIAAAQAYVAARLAASERPRGRRRRG